MVVTQIDEDGTAVAKMLTRPTSDSSGVHPKGYILKGAGRSKGPAMQGYGTWFSPGQEGNVTESNDNPKISPDDLQDFFLFELSTSFRHSLIS